MDLLDRVADYLDAEEADNEAAQRYRADPAAWARDKLGEHLWSKQVEISGSVRDNRLTAVQSCHRTGKCTVESATIQLADGRLAEAKDLVGRHFAILAWDEESGRHIPSLAWATNNGKRSVWRVTTNSGREVERTGNHPLWAGRRTGGGTGRRIKVESRGWLPIEGLAVGDLVLVPERIDVEGRRARPENEVKLAGYLIGGGGTTVNVTFTQTDGRPLDEFKQIVAGLGCDVRPTGKYGWAVVGTDGEKFGRWSGDPIINLLREWDLFGKKAKEKRLPVWAWELPNDQLALLLNRLFACDGWATVGGSNIHVGTALASERLIRDIELAMLRLGICGRVRARTSTVAEKKYSSWEWIIYRLADLDRFQQVVGIFGKEDAVERVLAKKRSTAGRPSRWMNRDAPPGHRWEIVRSLEPLGEQSTVCISVPDHHAFTTTFVEHNSFVASRLTAWWLDVHPPNEARVVTTAPTGDQVKAILWSEINGAFAKAEARGVPLPGRINETDWKLGKRLIAFGRKPSDYNPHAFQGIHAKYVLVIIDEACGVNKQFWTAALSIATGEHCRILAIGNPDDPGSHFARVCVSSRWTNIRISAFDSPNFTGETVPDDLRPMLVGESYEQEMRAEYGEQSPTYISKVLGLFPADAEDGVVRLSAVRACAGPQDVPLTPEQQLPVELGVDLGAGGDETCIRERRGILVGREWRTRDRDPITVANLIVEAVRTTKATAVKVDSIGIGWGIVGTLRERREQGVHAADVLGVNVGTASAQPERFPRLRSQIWWEIGRQLSEDRGWDLSQLEPDDRERLVSQLTAPKYVHDSSRRIVVEKKEDTKKRLGRSPDNADALLLAFYAAPGGYDAAMGWLAGMRAA